MLTDEQRTLVEQNMGLAYWYAHQMKWLPLELEERISMTLLGLTKAAEKYDPARGTSFATWARKVMHDEILLGFRKEKKHADVISLNLLIGNDDHRGGHWKIWCRIRETASQNWNHFWMQGHHWES